MPPFSSANSLLSAVVPIDASDITVLISRMQCAYQCSHLTDLPDNSVLGIWFQNAMKLSFGLVHNNRAQKET